MKNRLKKVFELDNLIYIFGIILLSYTFIAKYFENDLFFDIKTGESILKYGIDFKDHFSFIPNLIYLYHHWLYDIIIYYIYRLFSYVGVFFFFVLLFSVFSLIYYEIIKKITNSKIISFIITIVVMNFSSTFFQSRVQSITYILFLLHVLFLDKIYNGDKRYIIPIIINSILIVNLHMPLWIFTIILSLPFIVEGFISFLGKKNKSISKYFKYEELKNYKLFFITILLIIISGLISPHGLNPYTFFIKVFKSDGYSIINILELNSVSLINNRFSLLMLLLLIFGLYFKKINISIRDLLLFLGLFIFHLMAIRNISYFTLFAPLILTKSYYNKDLKGYFDIEFLSKLKSYFNVKIIKCFILLSIIVMIVAGIIVMDYKNYEFHISETFPVDAVKYIKENINYKESKIFNRFNYGSYLEFNDIPVFIDSRAEVYIKEFNGGVDIASDYSKSLQFDSYKRIFKKYDFDYALIQKSSKLDYILEHDNCFNAIYSDDNYVLYEVIKEQ